MLLRDQKHVLEAFDLRARKDSSTYGFFLEQAEFAEGGEMALLFALALGKAALKSMIHEVKRILLEKTAESEYH